MGLCGRAVPATLQAVAYLSIPAVPGDQGARSHELSGGTVSVGRAEGNDLVIIHGTLSRRHCELFKTETGTWHIRDLGSGNGVVIGGERITAEHALADGDQLTLGSVTVVFHDLGADFPTLFGPDDAPAEAAGESGDGGEPAVGDEFDLDAPIDLDDAIEL